MICAQCGRPAGGDEVTNCAACGADPRLDGRWRLLEELGRGATGTTFRAQDEQTGELVAIKEMPIGRASTAKARELLDREARVLGELDHPAIPRLVASRVVGEGRAQAVAVVQEFVDGVDLRTELATRRYTPLEVLHVAADLLDVLGYLHGLSPPVVHRDLKPANVMRRRDGRLVLLDFGAVRDSLRDLDLGGSTVAGTFGYMAPEQLVGDASPMSDLYALGATLVHLLSRVEPQKMAAVRGLQWEGRVAVPAGVHELLGDLLEPDPDRRRARLGSTATVRARVERLIEAPDRPTRTIPPVVRAPAEVRTPILTVTAGLGALVGGVAVLGVLGMSAGFLLFARSESAPVEVALPVEPVAVDVIPVERIPSPPEAVERVDVGLGDLPPIGAADAPVAIVAFFDYQCPFCVRSLGQLDDLVAGSEGRVAIHLRDFPLDFHEDARPRARAARCAQQQGKHRPMHDALLASPRQDVETVWVLAEELGLDRDAFERCLRDPRIDAAIDADVAAGKALGVTGTPTFFVDGERVQGAQPLEHFQRAVERALAVDAADPRDERDRRRDELRARLQERRAERAAQPDGDR